MNLLSRTPKQAVEQFEPALHEAGLSEDISIELSTKTPGTLEEQYRQWLNAGRGSPDILTMDVGWSIPFIRRGQLLNLSKALSDEHIQTLENEFNAESVDSSRGRNGDVFGVPLIMDVRGMWYRRDLAKEAGYDPDGENWGTEPKSWKEFSQIAAAVQKQQGTRYGLTMPFELSQTVTCCTFNSIMSQWGGAYFGGQDYLFGPVGDRPITIDEEQVLDSLRMLRTFMWGHDDQHSLDDDSFVGGIVPSDVLGWRYTKDLDAFLNGNSFAYTVGNPAFAKLASSESNFGDAVSEKLGLMPKPYGIRETDSEYQNIGGTMSPLAGYNLSVNPNSNKQDAALEVLRTVMTDDFLVKWFKLSGFLPPKPKLLQTKGVADHPLFGQYMDTFSVMADNVIPRPVTPIYFQESKVISQEVHNVVSQSKAPETGMTDAKKQLAQIEESYGQQ
ncbi:extracellular solute-binding protein [Halomicroarcula limicola]|uniref:Extracellular solute-binding protein n=1 Tax=Haloarcula limicola TaxID=1429915 RepID=A0A8J7Y7C7_9EURY|nr:extracellular solute-binding protein [Halomicroarcula limicola]MBV0925940.1 extracellular solute-binding protein [Halomicroarcula limicola]